MAALVIGSVSAFYFFIYIGPDARNSARFYQRDGHPAPSEFAPAGLFLVRRLPAVSGLFIPSPQLL